MARDEKHLIEELLPIWKKYADGFVFLLDTTTDGTKEFLDSVKEQYNILEILEQNQSEDTLYIETDIRQRLFDAAFKYSSNIICLDADEYLDGQTTKQQLELALENNKDSVFHLRWIQYISKNRIRTDGPWNVNFKDRIGSYSRRHEFQHCQMHSTHLPIPQNQQYIELENLFIAHLQWLSQKHVAIKQYYWKTFDYVNKKKYNIDNTPPSAYDASVNDFKWEEQEFSYQLKINENIFDKVPAEHSYKYKYIIDQTSLHDIPNLGDWGLIFKDIKKHIDLSVGIVTFKERKEHVKQLIKSIREHDGDNFDIILMVNGNNEEKMDESYRKDILEFCASIPRCYPCILPEFKSLSKLWNNIVINSNTEYNFIICDDVYYSNNNILDNVKDLIINTKEEFFKINNEFSHFVLTKTILHNLKYFDERLLAYGEEDGDIIYRYEEMFNKKFPNFHIQGIGNMALYHLKNKHSENHVDNKPLVNREIAKLKYSPDPNGISVMGGPSCKKNLEDIQQYPYEIFVSKNKHNTKKYKSIDLSYE